MENIQIPLKKVIPWVGLIIIAVAAGTYALTNLSTTDQIEALKEKLNTTSANSQTYVSPLPPPPSGIENSDQYNQMVLKINALEKERQVLVNELVGNSIKTLDPHSELSSLIRDLDSDSVKRRKEAVIGLFSLADRRSLPSLISYLNNRRDEAIKNKYLFEWYDFFWQLDTSTALSFSISEFESDDLDRMDEAFDELIEAPIVGNESALEKTLPKLESIAVTNANTLIRTRAKVLIEKLRKLSETQISDSMKGDSKSDENLSSVTVIFSIFNKNGIAYRFQEMIGDSCEVTYWKTGLFLANSFIKDEGDRENYIKSLETLVDINMADSSLGFNLFLLSKMEQFIGRQDRAIYWMNECNDRVPAVCKHLNEQNEVFDLKDLLPKNSK